MKKILCLFSFIVTVFVAQAQEQPMNGRNMQPPPPRAMNKEQRQRLELLAFNSSQKN